MLARKGVALLRLRSTLAAACSGPVLLRMQLSQCPNTSTCIMPRVIIIVFQAEFCMFLLSEYAPTKTRDSGHRPGSGGTSTTEESHQQDMDAKSVKGHVVDGKQKKKQKQRFIPTTFQVSDNVTCDGIRCSVCEMLTSLSAT